MFVWNSIRRRPVFAVALLILAADMIFVSILMKRHLVRDRFETDGIVIGRVVGKEIQNGKIYCYLKDVRFETAKEIPGREDYFLKHIGCVVSSDENDSLTNGRTVAFKGHITVYPKATNPGEFDMQKYMLSKGYLYKCNNAKLIYSVGKTNHLKETLFIFRSKCLNLLDSAYNGKDAGVMKAVLLADKTELDADTKAKYSRAGIGHLLAISGMHISLFANACLWITDKMKIPYKVSAFVTLQFLLAYGLMIGFPPSALRAIVMFGIMSLAVIVKGSYDMLTSMAVAALITVIVKPLCVNQSGFIMSYLAIIGMALVAPGLMPYHPRKRKLWNSVSGSLAVSLTTLPAVMNSYYRVPVWAFAINLLLLPSMSFLVGMGVASIAFEACGFSIPNIFAIGASLILSVYDKFTELEAELPFASVVTGSRSVPRCIIYLLALVLISSFIQYYKCKFFRRQKLLINLERKNPKINTANILKNEIKRKRRAYATAGAAMVIDVLILLLNVRTNRVDFVDVGQGLFVCVQYNGQIIAFDGGTSDKTKLYDYCIKNYFLYYGIDEVDAWFVSHLDQDHVSGLNELLADDEIKVKTLFFPRKIANDTKDYISLCEGRTSVVYIEAGNEIKARNITMEVLSPSSDIVYEDGNDASLVMYMVFRKGSFLFAGDSGITAERTVMKRGIHPFIYQVSHHGSAVNCNSEDYIDSLCPGIAVVSCGYGNSYEHPHKETLERLEKSGALIYRTDIDGCVSIPLNDSTLSLRRGVIKWSHGKNQRTDEIE